MRSLAFLTSVLSIITASTAQSTTLATDRTANTEVGVPSSVSPTETTPAPAQSTDSHTANTIVEGPTTVSPTETTAAPADSTSDEHTANTIVSGPTTVSQTTNTPATTGAAATLGAMNMAEVMGVALGGVALGMGVAA